MKKKGTSPTLTTNSLSGENAIDCTRLACPANTFSAQPFCEWKLK